MLDHMSADSIRKVARTSFGYAVLKLIAEKSAGLIIWSKPHKNDDTLSAHKLQIQLLRRLLICLQWIYHHVASAEASKQG